MSDISTSFTGNKYLIDEMIQSPKVLSEKILKTNSITCSITMPDPQWKENTLNWNTITIPFYMSDDFSFSVSNDWGSLIDTQKFFGPFTTLLNAISMFQGNAQVTMQSQGMSSLCWNGSTFDGFNLNCLFICTNRRINPVDIIQKLCKACLPARLRDYNSDSGAVNPLLEKTQNVIDFTSDGIKTFADATIDFLVSAEDKKESFKIQTSQFIDQTRNQLADLGMVAPLNYGVKFDASYERGVQPMPGTTLSLNIGDYFHASELVVESVSGIRFSKELIAPPDYSTQGANDLYDPQPQGTDYGFPLYATCQIKLRPFCLVDLKTFQQYFVKQPTQTFNNTTYNSNSDVLPQ